MKMLAYDASSSFLSAALFDGEKLLSTKTMHSLRHSDVLMSFISQILDENQVPAKKIDVLALGLGPGSFTGLRVGVATAKMLAFTLGWKLAGVSSLAALAQDVEGWRGPIAVILDAKKNLLYASFYEKDENLVRESKKPALMSIEQVLKTAKKQTYFTGSGVALYKEKLLESGKSFFSEKCESFPKAQHIGMLALQLIKAKKFVDPFKLLPHYLHPKDCNVTKRP